MEEVDYLIIGGPSGPTSLAIADYIRSGLPYNNTYALVIENSSPLGAAVKGVKTVNHIYTRLPFVLPQHINKYEEIRDHIKYAEILLKELYSSSIAFLGKSLCGLRLCRNLTEIEILEKLQGANKGWMDLLYKPVANFIRYNLGIDIDRKKMFVYAEKVWNIRHLIELYISKNYNNIREAKNVNFIDVGQDKVKIELIKEDGRVQQIHAKTVLVCKGMGNIEFEASIQNKLGVSSYNPFGFQALEFYKSIFQTDLPMPEELSSVFFPEKSICITNEQEQKHGVLYDVNGNPISVGKLAADSSIDILQDKKKKLCDLHPSMKKENVNEFLCSMPFDSQAHKENPAKHFEFIVTQSVIKNIRYYNLTYFTAIAAAIQKLPTNLNDL